SGALGHAIEQRHDIDLVRDRHAEASEILHIPQRVHHLWQVSGRDMKWAKRCVNTFPFKLLIEEVGSPYMVHGVAHNEEDACEASNLQGYSLLMKPAGYLRVSVVHQGCTERRTPSCIAQRFSQAE